MRISEGVEWALHCLVLLATVPPDRALPAARLAEFHGVPAPYLAKHLQALSRAGLVDTVPGPRGGYRLTRRPRDVTMLEVVQAVEGPSPAFTCTEIRQRGPAALPGRNYRVLCGIHRAMIRAEDAYRAVLNDTTLNDLIDGMLADASPEGLLRGAQWLEQVLS